MHLEFTVTLSGSLKFFQGFLFCQSLFNFQGSVAALSFEVLCYFITSNQVCQELFSIFSHFFSSASLASHRLIGLSASLSGLLCDLSSPDRITVSPEVLAYIITRFDACQQFFSILFRFLQRRRVYPAFCTKHTNKHRLFCVI